LFATQLRIWSTGEVAPRSFSLIAKSKRVWLRLDVDLTQMHAVVVSSAGRDPVWQSGLGKF